MKNERKVRVMLVEDSPTVRTLLCHIIDRDPRLQLAVVCVTAEKALESIAQVASDVISMDIRLPGMDGLEAMPAGAMRLGGVSVSLPQDLIAARLIQIVTEKPS